MARKLRAKLNPNGKPVLFTMARMTIRCGDKFSLDLMSVVRVEAPISF
jgi:hypothetical protein